MRMQTIEISPVIPAARCSACRNWPPISPTAGIAPTRALFEDLDQTLWRQTQGQSAADAALRRARRSLDARRGATPSYLRRYREVLATFDRYQSQAPCQAAAQPLVAYFCAEYGFHESFPIYSGGLGILAGDHCKAASDEQLNFVAVGLLYRQGYFTQSVDSDGVQHAGYSDADPRDLPVEPVRDAAGNWLTGAACRSADREVEARLWRAQVGRVRVYLLDTNCREQRRRPTATSPSASTAATSRTASRRKWCSASAACARCARSASRPPSGT